MPSKMSFLLFISSPYQKVRHFLRRCISLAVFCLYYFIENGIHVTAKTIFITQEVRPGFRFRLTSFFFFVHKSPSGLIRYRHEHPCTLNSVVFELPFCLLFVKSIMMTLWVHPFGVIWIMFSDLRSFSWFIKGTDEYVTREESSVPLMHQ